MSPLIVACVFGILLLIQTTILFHFAAIKNRAKAMTMLWLLNLPLLVISCAYSYENSLLPFDSLIGGLGANICFCVFFYFAGFFGGILQLYNLADRGFSLRIIIDLLEKKGSNSKIDEIMAGYSQGRGIKWMYQKRLDDMTQNKLMQIDAGKVQITDKGGVLIYICTKLRKLYNFAN